MTSIKIITDKKFASFLEKNPISDIEFCEVTKFKNDEEIFNSVKGVNLLFVVTDEFIADKITVIADSHKVDLILVILREEFERHARSYIFPQAHSTTAIPYSKNQDEICYKIIKAIADSLNLGEVEFETVKNFFCDSEYFEYKFGEVNNSRIKWIGEDFQLRDVCFRTFNLHLYEVLNLKVVSSGKKHFTDKINKCIAYDDINDLETDSDMETAIKGIVIFLFLIVEPDRKNLKKYKRLIQIAKKYNTYPFIITISILRDDSIGSIDADINVRTNDIQAFYEDFIYRFDRRLKFDDDEINTLIEYRKVRIEYFRFEPDSNNTKLKEFISNFNAQEFFIYVWFDYLNYDSDYEKRSEEQKKIFKHLDELNFSKELYHYWYGENSHGSEDKILVAFYIKE